MSFGRGTASIAREARTEATPYLVALAYELFFKD